MVTDPLIGRTVDSRYEVVGLVARGGMATVYRAWDKRLERIVAIKLMHAHLADSPDFVARFRREARAAARLSNPGVVAVYDQGTLDGVAYLVMEYVDGPTLRDLLNAGPLSVTEALDMTTDVLRALGAAHRAGLVHRDIKPENVLMPRDGSDTKVADFGLARAVTEATQTSTGNILGTVAYLAPELITSGSAGPRVDIYSVGVMLFEMLTGSQPFEADTPIQIAFQAVHEDVPAPSSRIRALPTPIDELVRALTQREPQQRCADADAALSLVRGVRSLLSEQDLRVRGTGPGSEPRSREELIGVALRESQGDGEEPAVDAPSPEGTAPLPTGDADSVPAAPPAARSRRQARSEEPAPSAASSGEPHSVTAWRLPRNEAAALKTVSVPIGSLNDRRQGAVSQHGDTTLVQRPARGSQAPTTALHFGEDDESRAPARPPRRRAVLAAASVLLLGSAGSAVWYVGYGPGRRIAVPSVNGLDASNARQRIIAAGLDWGETSEAYSDTVPVGTVISTTPAQGRRLREGSTVRALVSKGVEQKQVPNVVSRAQDDARDAIKAAGLAVGAITQEYSDDIAQGNVVSTSPAAGETVPHSTAVTMVVSLGRQPATVPDVTGMTVADAQAALEAAGLVMGEQSEAFSDTVPAGSVVSSAPAAQASGYFHGDTVTLVVSKGPELVTVPDVTSKSRADAVSTLEAAGFSVKVEKVLGGIFGTARYTDPQAGEKVPRGSTITLYIV